MANPTAEAIARLAGLRTVLHDYISRTDNARLTRARVDAAPLEELEAWMRAKGLSSPAPSRGGPTPIAISGHGTLYDDGTRSATGMPVGALPSSVDAYYRQALNDIISGGRYDNQLRFTRAQLQTMPGSQLASLGHRYGVSAFTPPASPIAPPALPVMPTRPQGDVGMVGGNMSPDGYQHSWPAPSGSASASQLLDDLDRQQSAPAASGPAQSPARDARQPYVYGATSGFGQHVVPRKKPQEML